MAAQMLDYFVFLKKKLLADRDNDASYDVVRIKVGDQIYRCHRNILASNSEYFAAFFKTKKFPTADGEELFVTLSSDHVKKCVLPCIIDAMYGEPFKILADNVIPLFITSSYLRLTFFISRCETFIRSNIHVLNISELLTIPVYRFNQSLYDFAKDFALKNFSSVYPRLAGISLEILEHLLSQPEMLSSKNKKHIMDFGRLWIAHDLKGRKSHLWKVSSILKPFYTSSDRSLTRVIVGILDVNLKGDQDVRVALNTLLELRSDRRYERMKYGIFDTDSEQLREKVALYDSQDKEMLTNEETLESSNRPRSPLIISESHFNVSQTLNQHQPFDWKLSCQELLQLLWTNEDSEPFRQSNYGGNEVNSAEIGDNVPADLNDLQKKLDSNEYSSPYKFWSDLKILIFNTKRYCTLDTKERIYEMAGRLSTLAGKQMRPIILRYRTADRPLVELQGSSDTSKNICQEDSFVDEALSGSICGDGGSNANQSNLADAENPRESDSPIMLLQTSEPEGNVVFVDIKQEISQET